MEDLYEDIELENSALIQRLSNQVDRLKEHTIDIRDETDRQNRMLDNNNNDFDSAHDSLLFTMGKLARMSMTGRKPVLCYLMAFAFILFFVVFFMIR